MVLVAISLIIFGAIVSLFGYKLFSLLLPIVGLVAGGMLGFVGLQAMAGASAASTAVAVLVSLISGLVFAVLAFVFFDLALKIFGAFVGAWLLSYLGVALGLNEQGFIVFLLALCGAIWGFGWVLRYPAKAELVVRLTAFLGVAYVLVGSMLLVGNITLDDLHGSGVVPTLLNTVDQALVWLLAWVGGGLIASNAQTQLLQREFLDDRFQYSSTKAQSL